MAHLKKLGDTKSVPLAASKNAKRLFIQTIRQLF